MSELLKKYIRLVMEGDIARVPNQLLSPDEEEPNWNVRISLKL